MLGECQIRSKEAGRSLENSPGLWQEQNRKNYCLALPLLLGSWSRCDTVGTRVSLPSLSPSVCLPLSLSPSLSFPLSLPLSPQSPSSFPAPSPRSLSPPSPPPTSISLLPPPPTLPPDSHQQLFLKYTEPTTISKMKVSLSLFLKLVLGLDIL